jgi:hypothetical protein
LWTFWNFKLNYVCKLSEISVSLQIGSLCKIPKLESLQNWTSTLRALTNLNLKFLKVHKFQLKNFKNTQNYTPKSGKFTNLNPKISNVHKFGLQISDCLQIWTSNFWKFTNFKSKFQLKNLKNTQNLILNFKMLWMYTNLDSNFLKVHKFQVQISRKIPFY